MSSGPLRVPGAKATLLLSLGMTMLGFWGALGSAYQLSGQVPPPASGQEVSPEVAAQIDRIAEEVRASHLDEGAAVANLLASALLIIGSLLLSARRATALWWTGHALLANILYTIGVTGVQLMQLQQFGSPFVLLAIAQQGPLPEGVTEADLASVMISLAGGFIVLVGLALIGAYLLLARLARREDVGRFVRREAT